MGNFLPNALIRRLNEQEGFDSEAFVQVHEGGEKITSIRLNPLKGRSKPIFNCMKPVPWCDQGYYLEERPVFTLDPLYHAGCYYVQEASSMFLAHVMQEIGFAEEAVRALDLCAAPGGKSTLMNSYLGKHSLLVSNEVIKSRANILSDSMLRWGTSNVVVTNNDPSAFSRLPGYFDLMVVDAPCSGSGMFRKDPQAIDEWSLSNVKLCRDRQKRILAESLETLKTGGYLVYSTCSYSKEENEDVVDWLITQYDFVPFCIKIDPTWNIEESRSEEHGAPGYRFYPHRVKGEGFFIAVLRKEAEQATFSRRRGKEEKNLVPNEVLRHWIIAADENTTFMHNDNIHVFPKRYAEDLKWLQEVLYIKQAGTNIGKWIGRELVPSHDLACSINIRPDLPAKELTLDCTLQFLRKESLSIDIFDGVKSGWCLVQYKGVNIGWVKVLSNRINNYYPKEIRIMNL